MPLDHYVSQVHLKRFYSPALQGRMYAAHKSDLKFFQPDAKSVCRQEDGNTNKFLLEERTVEEFLKTIEPHYNRAVETLRSGKIDDLCIHVIAGFVCYIIVGSPCGMRISSGPMKSTLERTARMMDARGMFPPTPPVFEGKSLSELLDGGKIHFSIDPEYPQAIGITTILKQLNTFGNSKWDILHNPFPDNPFFTSDFPAAIEKTNNPRILNRVVPLAPDLAIRIIPDFSADQHQTDLSFKNFKWRFREISRAEVVFLNRLIVQCAEETVFYRDDLSWVQPFITKNRFHKIEAITLERPSKNGVLQFSTQRIVRASPVRT